MEEEPWKKTKELFSKIISTPPLIEKYLKRPSPKYIFSLVINTMNKTGFPKGLFTPEEEKEKYFMSDVNHKKEFLTKIIDITKLITKINLEIDLKNILTGLEPEKTNILLQNFYTAATSKINFAPIITNYLNKETTDLNEKKDENEINEEKNKKPKNKIKTIKINEKEKSKGIILWTDKNVNNNENITYIKFLKENSYYEKLHLDIICFEEIEDAFNLLYNYINFNLIFVIVSGSLYPLYYQKLKQNLKYIKCLPICIIFTSDKLKDIYLSSNEYDNKKINAFKNSDNYITEEVIKSINNSFYNLGGVSTNFNSCINFIFNFYISLQNKFELKSINKSSYDDCITFEYVYTKNQLIFPFFYNEIMKKGKISDNEIQIFKNFLLVNHRENEIVNLILPMLYIKDIPHEIVVKFFLRAYTEQTSFCYEMNKLLMKQKGDNYHTFIKLMFEGLLNKSLIMSFDEYLYRGTKMTRNEIDKIIELFNQWNKKGDLSIPSFLLYSRCFLSFSKDENQILNFIGKTDENFYGIVFILKNKENLMNNLSSNADIEFLSRYKYEKEVLFFPFSCFCLKDIQKGNFKGKDCLIINLDYLGKYNNTIKDIINSKEFANNFIDTFKEQNYINEIMKSNIILPKNDNLIEDKKKVFKKIKSLIKDNYDIEIKEENINENKTILPQPQFIINIEEKIIFEKKRTTK